MKRIGIIAFCGLMVSGVALADAAPPAPPVAGLPSSSGLIALNSLPNPSTALATAHVADAKGMVVGAVQKIVLDISGTPVMIDVSLLGSGAVVAVAASQFNYDQGHNVLTAQMDAAQIAQEPRAPG